MLKIVCVPLLIVGSSAMMAFAWIGHLKWDRTWGYWTALLFSWLIVLPEYVLNVRATKWGLGTYTGGQMAAIHLCSGVLFVCLVSRYHLGEPLTTRQGLGFLLMALSFALVMSPGDGSAAASADL